VAYEDGSEDECKVVEGLEEGVISVRGLEGCRVTDRRAV